VVCTLMHLCCSICKRESVTRYADKSTVETNEFCAMVLIFDVLVSTVTV